MNSVNPLSSHTRKFWFPGGWLVQCVVHFTSNRLHSKTRGPCSTAVWMYWYSCLQNDLQWNNIDKLYNVFFRSCRAQHSSLDLYILCLLCASLGRISFYHLNPAKYNSSPARLCSDKLVINSDALAPWIALLKVYQGLPNFASFFFSGCGKAIVTKEKTGYEGRITSPYYPSYYPPKCLCAWNFQVTWLFLSEA